MFNSNILDVAVGLVFVFLMLSLISSAANELIETFWRKRAAYLEKGIMELVGGVGSKPSQDFVQKIYDHGLVNSLYVGSYTDAKKILPTYIPSRNFAIAVLDLWKSGEHLPANVGKALAAFDKVAQAKARSVQERAEMLQREVENWYNSSMDRVSGWYKRRSQIFVIVIGVSITVLVNADCLQIAKRLSTDPNMRQAAARLAEKQSGQASTPAPGTPAPDTNATLDQMKKNLADLDGIGLPLGWSPRPRSLADVGNGFLEHWVGWLITALAVSLGAPFWFDVLNKIIVVRSTVKPSEKSGPEASKDPTGGSQKPMVLTVQSAGPVAQAPLPPGGGNPPAPPDAIGSPDAGEDADAGAGPPSSPDDQSTQQGG